MKPENSQGNSPNNKRIARNTLYLYLRMAVLMGISIFTSRVLLDKLGVTDYGIYNVVGGVTVLLGFFSSSLTNASQRFLTFELGRKDVQKANVIFNQHLIIYFLIVLGVLLLAESVGLWFVYTQLVIPDERVFAAVCVYHFTVVSLCLTLLGIVFNACIVAHEAMGVFSLVGIFQGVANLGIVYLLVISSFDKLIFYAFLMFLIAMSVQIFYVVYCLKHYEECKLRWVWDKGVIKETSGLIGWNTVGTAVYAINDSGVNILMNLFFGPTINAARSLSAHIGSAVGSFAGNFYTSVRPPLTKAYASGDYEYMMKLFYNSSKYSFYLLWIISLPVIFAIDELLSIWLIEVPDYVGSFTIWILLYSAINTLNNPIWTIALAVGKLKRYISIGSGVFLLVFPISYVVLKLGYSPVSVFIIMVLVRFVYLVVVLHIIADYIPLTRHDYVRKVVSPIVKSVLLSGLLAAVLDHLVSPDSFWGTFTYCVLACLLTALSIGMIGVSASERALVWNFLRNRYMSHKTPKNTRK